MKTRPLCDREFQLLLSLLPDVNITQGPWITGGSARRLWQGADWKQGDVDVFFTSDHQRAEWLAAFDKIWNYSYKRFLTQSGKQQDWFDVVVSSFPPKKELPQATLHMETENAMTFDLFYEDPHTDAIQNCKLQVIKVRQADSLQKLWHDFDFNLCCFAVDSKCVYADPAALQDLDLNQISPRSTAHSKNMPLRVVKHFCQGLHVSDDLLKQAMKQISDGDVDWCNTY